MELVLDKPIISVSIIKEVSYHSSFYGFMHMFTFLVPDITPNVSVIPGAQISLNININVSILTIHQMQSTTCMTTEKTLMYR